MHPDISQACTRLTSAANYIATRLRRKRLGGKDNPSLRHQGNRVLEETSLAFVGRVGQYSIRDLDRLAGCLTRLEALTRATPPALHQLRAHLAPRLGIPSQGEAMLRRGNLRGQAGRYPTRNLAALLRQQGFLVRIHFLERLRERALNNGVRFDFRVFRQEFDRARHYRQNRDSAHGYNNRIAIIRGTPILYTVGGNNGNRIVLIGVLPSLPRGVEPIAPPRLREAELMVPG